MVLNRVLNRRWAGSCILWRNVDERADQKCQYCVIISGSWNSVTSGVPGPRVHILGKHRWPWAIFPFAVLNRWKSFSFWANISYLMTCIVIVVDLVALMSYRDDIYLPRVRFLRRENNCHELPHLIQDVWPQGRCSFHMPHSCFQRWPAHYLLAVWTWTVFLCLLTPPKIRNSVCLKESGFSCRKGPANKAKWLPPGVCRESHHIVMTGNQSHIVSKAHTPWMSAFRNLCFSIR